MNLDEKISLLSNSDNTVAYKALKELLEISSKSDEVYAYFDEFVAMMSNSNSYIRTRGLRLIAFNSKWDNENKINLVIDEYLTHIEDEKPITSRQCIKDTYIIAQNKPELTDKILESLQTFDKVYNDSMQKLIYQDRQKAIRQIQQNTW
ncbi:hypothetical protein M2475_000330 [Breznakia sp. PF5-3]|uniref:hypothetical protein n=1 Tax=unclassified Breznakia TaxID=2623764 RepID=UPI0024071362|nr:MULTISPECIES: hypothetical protein [unclassified Breznakia]MDF9823982.1 hypothetical protein [Breznakia sp. PM6-1]MDF9834781.1 hypothetical protein [Breznakia sp. PF5-3]MDF9838048.1 hypothetical protein [Breznakia sp. PFB2-8]MDF9860034.1 hypothetical protein [Breznakia sp. PH5-24]